MSTLGYLASRSAELSEKAGLSPGLCALALVMQVLRSLDQGEQATAEGVASSIDAWVDDHGEPDLENVMTWLDKTGLSSVDLNKKELGISIGRYS